MNTRNKISIINAKYSPNLGDGVIAETLEFFFKNNIPNVTVNTIDIGGNLEYGHENSMARGTNKQLFNLFPDFLKKTLRFLLRSLLIEKKYGTQWKEQIHDSDLLVLGGGHLLMDSQWYFPMRIKSILTKAKPNTPLLLCSLGVSQTFSSLGKKLFRDIFKYHDCRFASLRDTLSKQNFDLNFSDIIKNSQMGLDPALLCPQVYKDKTLNHSDNHQKIIALGITDPDNMKSHCDNKNDVVAYNAEFFQGIIQKFTESGFKVKIFNNGVDHAYMLDVVNIIRKNSPELLLNCDVCEQFLQPCQLVDCIKNSDLMISHRLHANIIAYAYDVPNIGIMWDEKVKSFFKLTQREDFLLCHNSHEALFDMSMRTLSEKIEPTKRKEILDTAQKNIDNIMIAAKDALKN